MLRSGAKKNTRYFTSELSHKIIICSMRDVVENTPDGVPVMTLSREAALETWARIERTKASNYSVEGRNMMQVGGKPKQTHLVIIRARHNVEFSTAAWIFERRRQSAPRWYKILDWIEDEDFNLFEVHIYERSDKATPPVGEELLGQERVTLESQKSLMDMTPLPSGVRL